MTIVGEGNTVATYNVTAVVCSIVIPCAVLAIGLGIWAFIFYKKGGYMKYSEEKTDERETLL